MAVVCLSVLFFSLSLLFSAHLEVQGPNLEAAGLERFATVRSVVYGITKDGLMKDSAADLTTSVK